MPGDGEKRCPGCMSVIMRGRRVLLMSAGPNDGLKPVKKPPCSYCGAAGHAFSPTWGSHIGNSWLLADAILQGREPTTHDWYTGSRSIAAHHLICSEAMADDEDWARYCRQFGYDINRKENGVMLPSELPVSCELHVPLHRGNHSLGWAHDVELAYPDAVMARLREVADMVESGTFCKDPAGLVKELDELSAEILAKVADFEWTLSRDGQDYQPGGPGCAGVESIPDKPRRACPRQRQHGIRHAATGQPLVRRPLREGT
jgi:hypothetical protein